MPIHQSFSWWCYANRGVEDSELLRQAKAIGYDAVELLQPDQFEMAHHAGLAIASHPAHKDISHGLNNLDEHDRIEQEILANIELAKKYKIPTLITFSGERRAGQTDGEAIEVCAIGLKRVVKQAEDAGIYLSMELLNSKVDHHGYQCDKTAWGVKLCDRVESPMVKLLYDIYHMQIMEGDIIRTIQDFNTYFSHYHTAGNPGRRDMDDEQELNYSPIMKAILKTGYSGFVGHEFIPKGDTVQALKAAWELCNV